MKTICNLVDFVFDLNVHEELNNSDFARVSFSVQMIDIIDEDNNA